MIRAILSAAAVALLLAWAAANPVALTDYPKTAGV